MVCYECKESTDEPEKLHWKVDPDGWICPECKRKQLEEEPDEKHH